MSAHLELEACTLTLTQREAAIIYDGLLMVAAGHRNSCQRSGDTDEHKRAMEMLAREVDGLRLRLPMRFIEEEA